MNLKANLAILLLLLACSSTHGQIEQYDYKRPIKGVTEEWHKLTLPDELFEKILPGCSDLRIFGITAKGDTVEAPYVLRVATEKVFDNEINFKILNTSHTDKGYFLTVEVPAKEAINQIKLDFSQQNFDWKVKLEGSHDQQEWFTIVEDYRILSIKNKLTDYQFTTLSFPDARYHFFRLFFEGNEKPVLTAAKVSLYDFTEGNFRNYPIKATNISENKQTRQTEIVIDLALPVSVSRIKIDVDDDFDYYRPLVIRYLSDSVKTDQGWKYVYNTLSTGTLSSVEQNEFKFPGKTVQRLKILIDNRDNRPLSIERVDVKGYVHELAIRFTEPAEYFVVYGNDRAAMPRYDIERFVDKIPAVMAELELGEEHRIDKQELPAVSPLFKNKAWLWVIMAVIILLLGGFTLKMLKQG